MRKRIMQQRKLKRTDRKKLYQEAKDETQAKIREEMTKNEENKTRNQQEVR